jgi:hypothetical protein
MEGASLQGPAGGLRANLAPAEGVLQHGVGHHSGRKHPMVGPKNVLSFLNKKKSGMTWLA